jgi:hypothetical protein
MRVGDAGGVSRARMVLPWVLPSGFLLNGQRDDHVHVERVEDPADANATPELAFFCEACAQCESKATATPRQLFSEGPFMRWESLRGR